MPFLATLTARRSGWRPRFPAARRAFGPLDRPRGRLAVYIALALSAAAAAPIQAQNPELYSRARAELERGDTLAALARLRELTEAEPDFAPGWGLLGGVLTERASGVATDFEDRVEAEKALRQALRLDFDNPAYLMTLGSLKRKQQMYLDARRVLKRAQELADRAPGSLTPAERAQLWYQLGLYYEDIYLDTRDLVFVPDLPVQTPECAGLGTFCLNFTRPKRFNERFRHAGSLGEEGDDDLEGLLTAFWRAFDADPTHAGAFRRLAVHLVELRNYRDAFQVAERYRRAAPDSPWGHLTLGLVHARQGEDSLAQLAFDAGLAVAGDDIAAHYRDIRPLLRESTAEQYSGANAETRRQLEALLWRKSDPLYLSEANEVRVAHLARVAFADLWFEDPSSGRWGAGTERGRIYVRYGPPERIWQVRRDVSRELSGDAFGVRAAAAQGGGRWIFWNYGWDVPNFIFEKQLRWRHAKHMLSSASKMMEEGVRELEPAVYSTSFELLDYPLQIARFRGAADTIVEVDFYTEIPGDRLLVRPDTLELGFFLFSGVEHTELFRRTLRAAASPSGQAITYSLPLLAGEYGFSAEARAREGKAAVQRGTIELHGFRAGQLALSDIVLADAVTPKSERPEDRRGFALKVNRRSEFGAGLPLAVYWEVYGLEADADGLADYRVELRVTDAEGQGVLAKIGRIFGIGDSDQVELEYERVVEWNGERVPEYLSISLPEGEPGTYRLSIVVTDRMSGQDSVASREFRVHPID